MSQHADLKDYQNGDKIRVRAGQYTGLKGVVVGVDGQNVGIQSELGVLDFDSALLTNYSLAARRAWEKMPKKAGRPKSESQRKKVVSIRIEEDLWAQLAEAVAAGLIVSREHAINEWIRAHLQMVHEGGKE